MESEYQATAIYTGQRVKGDETDRDADAHRARYQWAASMMTPGMKVLDYGCGYGYGTKILQDAGCLAVGYDPDPAAIEYARARYGVPCSEILAPHAGWDAVVSFEVLEHLAVPPFQTYVELERMAPIVIASVPYLEKEGANDAHRWFRLQESTFPGRRFAYQFPDGAITPHSSNRYMDSYADRGPAQNLLIITFPSDQVNE